MRVAIVAESFLPQVNGVTHSLLRVLEHLEQRGDTVLVVAPAAPRGTATTVHGRTPVVRVPSAALPGYQAVRVGWSGVGRLARTLADFAPDVVHLASPFVLGWQGAQAARQLDLPSVAVYQTEVPAYAGRYGVGALESFLWGRVREIHEAATLTLAPSTHACRQLAEHGVPRVRLWPRGVDSVRFAPEHRDDAWRRSVAPDGEVVLGYVGRLAPEKQLDHLAAVADLLGTRLVLVGDGPDRDRLARALPRAVLTGQLEGADLARAVASMDVLVHPSRREGLARALPQGALARCPVVTYDVDGNREGLIDGKTGFVIPPFDKGKLSAALDRLMGDAALRRSMGEAGRAFALSRFDTRVMVDGLERVYREAVGPSAAEMPSKR